VRALESSAATVMEGPLLAARMAADGYLYLPGLLPPRVVADVQGGGRHRAGRGLAPSRRAAETYHGLKHHPALLGFFERMLGASVFPHPRVLMRNIFPAQPEYTTKAHQDYPNVQGTTEVYTAWIPLIDCPPERGGLQEARGSHRLGVLDFGIGNGAGGIENY
jgi:ectoine hydroxylase-related dioxygenase (phytanoyl-CoA dioxygenase family)